MNEINRYVYRMFALLAVTILATGALHQKILGIFKNNMALNGFILTVFAFGVVWVFYQIYRLRNEQIWLDAVEKGEEQFPGKQKPNLLKPLAITLAEPTFNGSISPIAARSLLVSIENRLDETRDINRYLIGLLVFLGLLGTFWGLSQTIGAIAGVIGGLDIGGSAKVDGAFQTMKEGLHAPLAGMGTAFSCSMFGLAGSLFLGLFDLQYNKALGWFYNALEEKIAYITKQSATNDATPYNGPAYSHGLLEQTIEAMSGLQSLMRRGEENRSTLLKSMQSMSEKLNALTEQMAGHQTIMKKIAQNHVDLQESLAQTLKSQTNTEKQDLMIQSLRSLDTATHKLLEEVVEGRARTTSELRNEIRLIARTLSALANGQEVAA